LQKQWRTIFPPPATCRADASRYFAERAQRKPRCDMPLSGGAAMRALGR
jgi:hypothetical protein